MPRGVNLNKTSSHNHTGDRTIKHTPYFNNRIHERKKKKVTFAADSMYIETEDLTHLSKENLYSCRPGYDIGNALSCPDLQK
jgi:tRNA nucleotidyltransferase (CCA-adding enzyme)